MSQPAAVSKLTHAKLTSEHISRYNLSTYRGRFASPDYLPYRSTVKMLSPTLSLLLFVPLLLTVVAQPTSSTPSITWTDCKLNTTLSITCGTLPVPLDYTDDSSNETLDLQLVRLKAVNQPNKGSVLFNPGGPGIGGRNFLIEVGEAFQMYGMPLSLGSDGDAKR